MFPLFTVREEGGGVKQEDVAFKSFSSLIGKIWSSPMIAVGIARGKGGSTQRKEDLQQNNEIDLLFAGTFIFFLPFFLMFEKKKEKKRKEKEARQS